MQIQMEKVLAIVVTHNRCHILKRCIESIRRQTYRCDILVVDNASDDDTVAFLHQAQNDCFHILLLKENIGGAGGFNIGIRWGVEQGYDYIWVMDDDTLPEELALNELMSASEKLKGQYGFLSSSVLWIDGSPCKMNVLHPIKKKPILIEGIIPINQSTFVSCLFPVKIILKYGLPIKDFFIWGDDMEYTRRIAVRGKEPCYWIKKSEVIHEMKTNNGSAIATDEEQRLHRYNYAYRNENYFYRQEGIKGFIHFTIRCMVHSVRIICYASDNRKKRLSIIWKQYWKGLQFNPHIEYVGITPHERN